jgi:hypothetical protein
VKHLLPLFPRGERSLLACVVEKLDECHHRVDVGQVTREQDLELVGEEIELHLTEQTEIVWIGDDTLDAGTWLLIPVPETALLMPEGIIEPSTITLQNGTLDAIIRRD